MPTDDERMARVERIIDRLDEVLSALDAVNEQQEQVNRANAAAMVGAHQRQNMLEEYARAINERITALETWIRARFHESPTVN
jgi:hypothetical protein